jgi:hypothetical protein
MILVNHAIADDGLTHLVAYTCGPPHDDHWRNICQQQPAHRRATIWDESGRPLEPDGKPSLNACPHCAQWMAKWMNGDGQAIAEGYGR